MQTYSYLDEFRGKLTADIKSYEDFNSGGKLCKTISCTTPLLRSRDGCSRTNHWGLKTKY